jgi:hypothetical protein
MLERLFGAITRATNSFNATIKARAISPPRSDFQNLLPVCFRAGHRFKKIRFLSTRNFRQYQGKGDYDEYCGLNSSETSLGL